MALESLEASLEKGNMGTSVVKRTEQLFSHISRIHTLFYIFTHRYRESLLLLLLREKSDGFRKTVFSFILQ